VYFSLPIPSGQATLPLAISDVSLAFALAAAHGMMAGHPCLPQQPDYRNHLGAIPWRLSVFLADDPSLLPAIACRRTIDAECGAQPRFTGAAKRGNLKDYFFVQAIPPAERAGSRNRQGLFRGGIWGPDPFPVGEDHIVVRLGKNRSGQLLIERNVSAERLHLNAFTARLFGRNLSVERYLLDSLQLTPPLMPEDAARELQSWTA
jgi:hypothetical protein